MLKCFLLALALSAIFGPAVRAGDHALILTNNRSLALGRPDLHYADDDGAKWTELFDELLGASHVTLLTEFDAPSSALFPALTARAKAPTRAALDQAVDALATQLAAEANEPRSVVLVFAGHGDTADGEGFLELADARLTATDLEGLIRRLPADHVHIVIDACNAYFMLYPRRPGGQRFKAPLATEGLLGRDPRVGAILSTSAEATAWEWSDIQSGLFSHVLRSGLRGGADVNHDGRIGYAELAAFLAVANAELADPYRPRIFSHAPTSEPDASVVRLDRAPRRAALELTTARRIAIRDARGVRVLDGNFEAGAVVPFVLPLGVLVVDEVATADGTTQRTSLRLDEAGTSIPLATAPADTAERGEAQPFRELFDKPFGARAYEQWAAAPKAEEAPYGVTVRDAERLGHVLASAARVERRDRRRGGVVLLGAGTAVTALGIAALDQDTTLTNQVVSGIVIGEGSMMLVTGILRLVQRDEDNLEDLDAEFRRAKLGTDEERASSVARFETRLHATALASASDRRLTAGVQMVAGGLILGVALWSATENHTFGMTDAFVSGAGVLSLGLGLYDYVWGTTGAEETWDLYCNLRELPWEPGRAPPKVTIVPVLAPIEGGMMGGAAMQF